jgi:GAF domain-containing protein
VGRVEPKLQSELLAELIELRQELGELEAKVAGVNELRHKLAAFEARTGVGKAVQSAPDADDPIAPPLPVTDDVIEALCSCLETALELTGMDCGGAYWVADPSGDLHLLAHRGLAAESVASCAYYTAESPAAQQVWAGRPSYIPYDELRAQRTEAQATEGLRTIAVVPIRHKGVTLACLNVASRSADQVAADTRRQLETMAALAGNAIARITGQNGSPPSGEQLRPAVRMPVL